MNPLVYFLMLQKARALRAYADWRQFDPGQFAHQITGGRTGCRHLLCQYKCPIPMLLSNKARLQNIQIICDRLNHVVIGPQQIFSLLHLLPEPSLTNGFKPGPHFTGKKVMLSYDMGLGQVASVLNFLALYAGAEILEVHPAEVAPKAFNHEYVPLGLEVCASWILMDFRFKNPFSFDLALQWQVSSNELIGTLFSKEAIDLRVKLDTETLETIPQKTLERPANQRGEPGQVLQRGSDGYRLRIRREVQQKQQGVASDIVAERSYAPVDKIVLV